MHALPRHAGVGQAQPLQARRGGRDVELRRRIVAERRTRHRARLHGQRDLPGALGLLAGRGRALGGRLGHGQQALAQQHLGQQALLFGPGRRRRGLREQALQRGAGLRERAEVELQQGLLHAHVQAVRRAQRGDRGDAASLADRVGGLAQVAPVAQDHGEAAPGQGGLGVVLAESALIVLHRQAGLQQRLVHVAARVRQVAQHVVRVGACLGTLHRIAAARPERGVRPGRGLLCRVGVVAVGMLDGQVGLREMQHRIVRRHRLREQRMGLAQHRERLVGLVEHLEHVAQFDQHVALQHRLPREAGTRPLQRAVEHLQARDGAGALAGGRFGVLDQVHQEFARRLRALRLFRRARMLARDQRARGRDQAGRNQRRHEAGAMARHEEPDPVRRRGRRRPHRPAFEHAPEVVAQPLGRRVAARRIDAQGAGQHAFEVGPQHGGDRLRRGAGRRRQHAGQQLLQHDAQRIDVHRRRDRRPAVLLLGRGIARRVGLAALVRGGLQLRRLGVQQLGDAEVEQLHQPALVDQQVRRLDVAVHDQVPVRMRDRVAGLQHQAQPGRPIQRVAGRMGDQVRPVDAFHHEVGPAVVIDPRVVQAGDVRVLQEGPDLALVRHALGQARALAQARQLERDLAFEDAVGPLGQPDAAHPAAPDLLDQPVGADELACQRLGLVRHGGRVEAGHGRELRAVVRQHAPQLRHQRLLRRRQVVQPGLLRLGRHRQADIQQATERRDVFRGQRHPDLHRTGGRQACRSSRRGWRTRGPAILRTFASTVGSAGDGSPGHGEVPASFSCSSTRTQSLV